MKYTRNGCAYGRPGVDYKKKINFKNKNKNRGAARIELKSQATSYRACRNVTSFNLA